MDLPQKINELHTLLTACCNRKTPDEICHLLKIKRPRLRFLKNELAEYGFDIRYSRSEDCYICDWPLKGSTSINLNGSELAYLKIASNSSIDNNTKLKIDSRTMLQQVFFDASASSLSNRKISDDIAPKIAACGQAAAERRLIEIGYGKSQRIVEPLHIITSAQSTYLLAWCRLRKQLRMFKFIRIKSIHILADEFSRRSINLSKYFESAWCVITGSETHDIKVQFFGEAANSICEYHLHPTQKIESKNKDMVIASWSLSNLQEFTSWLLQWSGEFKVIQPPELAQNIKNKIQSQLNLLEE